MEVRNGVRNWHIFTVNFQEDQNNKRHYEKIQMVKVKVYPDTNIEHTAKIYAGLSDLKAQGKIQVKYIYRCPSYIKSKREFNLFTLWLEVEDLNNGKIRKICFDDHDSGKIHALRRLSACDVYFKRSYCQADIDNLQINLRKKILPYGLNYSCRSINERFTAPRLLIYYFARNHLFSNPLKSLGRVLKENMKLLLSHYIPDAFNLNPPLVTDFEAKPDEPVKPKILFQTRVYSPSQTPGSDPKQLKELMDMRANTIRALKESFGNRFIGGLAHSDFAMEHYPDCLSVEKTNKKDYLALVRSCLITVTTTGLHNSIGWKLPEFLARSKCIVTEPFRYDLPVPLQEHKNYISFTTPEECVQACKEILDNPDFANQMRYNNYTYYLNEVEPSVHILNCLKKAFNWPTGNHEDSNQRRH